MTNEELINWCQSRSFKDPIKVAAILSIFNPDSQDLEEWEVEEDFSSIIVNDYEYEIESEQEANERLQYWKKSIQDQLLDEAPDSLRDFINWESFWKANTMTIENDLDLPYKLNFNGVTYYYNEYVG